MAGATAFFTTFALPAVLIILIQVFGLVLTPRFMTRQLVTNLGEVVGKNTAGELHKTLFNVRHLFRNWYEAFAGFLFLIFVATTLLNVIKDSLNQLWNIRPVPHLGIRTSLLNRLKARCLDPDDEVPRFKRAGIEDASRRDGRRGGRTCGLAGDAHFSAGYHGALRVGNRSLNAAK